ncbi:hypothetical protein FRC07_000552 [Ceratobasidium sp. 392]|nr:hypothetical protein FRC07_000552 [Ceratobasidium sp. 392]
MRARSTSMNGTVRNSNDLLHTSLRALHRPLNVLLRDIITPSGRVEASTPTNVLVPSTSGWVGNDATRTRARDRGASKKGSKGVMKHAPNFAFGAVRTELGSPAHALEAIVAGKNDEEMVVDQPAVIALQNVIPCANRVLTVPGPVVRDALASCDIAIVWRAMVALIH